MTVEIFEEIAEGRTDRVVDHLAAGGDPGWKDGDGVSLLQWCSYYGDVTGIKLLLAQGERLESLGEDYGLNTACFHGHWQLCLFLLEQGADANQAADDTGETPLHSTLCTTDRVRRNRVMQVLLAKGADPNVATKHSVETGAFMRDSRTKGETPLHRAAAFGDEEAIDMLLRAGAKVDAKDMNGDTPLSWASWYLRPTPILRKLLHGSYRIRPDYGGGMEANLVGRPQL